MVSNNFENKICIFATSIKKFLLTIGFGGEKIFFIEMLFLNLNIIIDYFYIPNI